jgi:hypothetical protein
MGVVAFSQRDPRWQAEKLGTGELTLGQAGCLVTAAASLLASWGVETDPSRLNQYVKQHYGYVDDNLFVFASVDGLNCRFVELIDCWSVPAPVDRLAAAVGAGAGVLVCVDLRPGGQVEQHWVWLRSLGERSGQIVDPWQEPGREQVEMGTYLKAGWTPARGIFLAAVYSRSEGSRAAWRSDRDAYQPMLCVWAPQAAVDEGDV